MTTDTAIRERLAIRFILKGVYAWEDKREDRVEAVQKVIDAAGFNATANNFPFMWRRMEEADITGTDALEARVWMNEMLATMPIGKVEREINHVIQAINRMVD